MNATGDGANSHRIQRILVVGGGFGGLYTAYHLDKIFRHHAGVEVTLVSRDNYFLMTPFLFEAGSGVLEPRHAVNPIRRMYKKVRFVEGDVERIDFETRTVFARHSPGGFDTQHPYALPYDQLVLALGGVTNRNLIPGAEHAFGFKTLSDAIFLRNKIIDLFERADVEEDPEARRRLLNIVVIGGGLVGVELIGELTEFIDNLLRSYPRLSRSMVKFTLVEAHPRILPEMEEDLAQYAADVLWKRGVNLMNNIRVTKIEPGKVFLPPEKAGGAENVIEAETILLAAGIAANPLLAEMAVPKARNGRIVVEGTMRCKERPEVWAIGDCALIPDPKGNPYPPLAQHALREARVLARNLAEVVRKGERAVLEPFVYQTMGMLASLGHYDGVGRIGPLKIRGFLAWWVWRTYYMLQMPRFERKLRVVMDWTVALLFRNDVTKLDLFGEEHPTERRRGEG